MITNEDINNIRKALKDDFATKDEFSELKGEVKKLSNEFRDFKDHVVKHMATTDELKQFATRDELFEKLDGMINLISTNQEEHKAGLVRMNRHEGWIKELAEHTNLELS